jgi:hypothetical protein
MNNNGTIINSIKSNIQITSSNFIEIVGGKLGICIYHQTPLSDLINNQINYLQIQSSRFALNNQFNFFEIYYETLMKP